MHTKQEITVGVGQEISVEVIERDIQKKKKKTHEAGEREKEKKRKNIFHPQAQSLITVSSHGEGSVSILCLLGTIFKGVEGEVVRKDTTFRRRWARPQLIMMLVTIVSANNNNEGL